MQYCTPCSGLVLHIVVCSCTSCWCTLCLALHWFGVALVASDTRTVTCSLHARGNNGTIYVDDDAGVGDPFLAISKKMRNGDERAGESMILV